jgi:hypothetical protein
MGLRPRTLIVDDNAFVRQALRNTFERQSDLAVCGEAENGRGEKRERWIRLCVEAADEQESNRFLELISEINRLLHEKEMRLRNVRPEATGFVIEAEKKAG